MQLLLNMLSALYLSCHAYRPSLDYECAEKLRMYKLDVL